MSKEKVKRGREPMKRGIWKMTLPPHLCIDHLSSSSDKVNAA